MTSTKFTLDKLIALLRWPLAALGVAYFVCMIAAPWIIGGWRWSYVQDVWDRWQGVNVGILAFAASFIAFEVSRYKENEQRKRDFLSVRAFLPESLSELCAYFKESAAVYIKAWEDTPTPATGGAPRGPAPICPELPSSYKNVFGECIKHAEPELSEVLTDLLAKLQVQDARLHELIREYPSVRLTIFSYLLGIGKLQTLVNKLFPFARGEDDFNPNPISWDEFHKAYKNLDIYAEDYDLGPIDGKQYDLINYTKRAIASWSGEQAPEYQDI